MAAATAAAAAAVRCRSSAAARSPPSLCAAHSSLDSLTAAPSPVQSSSVALRAPLAASRCCHSGCRRAPPPLPPARVLRATSAVEAQMVAAPKALHHPEPGALQQGWAQCAPAVAQQLWGSVDQWPCEASAVPPHAAYREDHGSTRRVGEARTMPWRKLAEWRPLHPLQPIRERAGYHGSYLLAPRCRPCQKVPKSDGVTAACGSSEKPWQLALRK